VNRFNDISIKAVDSTKWSAITEIIVRIISPITNMILARLLTPEAFGVVATINMIISFVEMLSDSGFQKYLIQHEFNNDEEKYESINVAFWTNLAMSIIIYILIVLNCNSIASMVGNKGMGIVISIASIQLPITSFSSIQMALYKRNFWFKKLFYIRTITSLIPLIITIPLAILDYGYWSIIIGNIVSQLVTAILLTFLSSWKPRLHYDFIVLISMFSYSFWILIESITIWLSGWIDVFIISNLLDEYYTGLYKTSTALVNAIMVIITSTVIPVMFSTLARLQNNEYEFNNVLLKFQRAVSYLIFPLGLGIYIYKDLATKILLGNRWLDASEVIGIWALSNILYMVIGYFCSEVYRVIGKPRISIIAQILNILNLVPICILGIKKGFIMFIYYRAISKVLFVIIHLIIMKWLVKYPVSKMVYNIIPSFVSSLFMGFVGFLLKLISQNLIFDIISILICIVIYLIILITFKRVRKDISEFTHFYKSYIRNS